MLVNPSGLPGHAMGIDLNIEHLIRYLKVRFHFNIYCLRDLTRFSHYLLPREFIQTGIVSETLQLGSTIYS